MASLKDASPLVPFDLYDFFGYIFPGIFFWICIAAWGYSCPQALPKYIKLLEIFNSANILFGIFAVISFLVIVYITGHFIATLSHLMDRVLVAGISGYPVIHILGLKTERRAYSDATVKYVFMLLNIFLMVPIFLCRNKMVLINKIILWLLVVLIAIRIVLYIGKKASFTKKKIEDLYSIINTSRLIGLIILAPANIIDDFFEFIKRVFHLDKNIPQSLMKS